MKAFFKTFFATLWALWMRFAHMMGRFNTKVILTIFFYLIISPVALVRRAFGHDPLIKRPDPKAESYWVKRPETDFKKENYHRQF